MDTVQKHKVKHTNHRWHPLCQCKVILTDENFLLEQWGRQDRKKHYMDKAKLEKVEVEIELEVDAVKNLVKERRRQ